MAEGRTDSRMGRRAFLGALGALGAVGAARAVGVEFDTPGTQVEVEEPESLAQALVKAKVILNLEKARFRLDFNRLDVFEKDENGNPVNKNIVNKAQIEELNNVPVSGKSGVQVENFEIVWGKNPNGTPEPAPWLRLRALKRFALAEPLKKKLGYIYLPLTPETRPYANISVEKPEFFTIARATDSQIITDKGPFAKSEVGKVTTFNLPT